MESGALYEAVVRWEGLSRGKIKNSIELDEQRRHPPGN